MQKFNILHLSGEKNWAGGEVQILNLCKGLRLRGYNCLIACPKDSVLLARAVKENFSVEKLSLNRFFGISCLFKLIKIIKKNNIDIVHAHSYNVYFLGALATKLTGNKTFILTRYMDFVLNRINKIFLNKTASKIIALSKSVYSSLIASGINPSKVITIYGSINLEEFTLKNISKDEQSDRLAKNYTVATLANLCERKGIRFLIDAAKDLVKDYPGIKFLIAGKGPEKEKLKLYADDLDLSDNVIFTGFKEDIKDFLLPIDIFVLPSLREALGVAILEAMALEKPVIAAKVGGIPEIIVDGVTGFIVPTKDSKALVKKIDYLLKNPEKARTMGKEGRRRIEERFNNKETILKHDNLYRQVYDNTYYE